MANGCRRHYRVAQKEIEQSSNETERNTKVCVIVFLILSIIIFIKGFIIGYIISSKVDKNCNIC